MSLNLKSATVSHLPVAVATRKRMIQLHHMVMLSMHSNCRDDSDLIFLRGVDICIFTTLVSHDMHIHEQGTS